jgi:DNA-binding MarR family transcriptional regulator
MAYSRNAVDLEVSITVTDNADAWRHSNVGRLLNNAMRRFESRVFELMNKAGHTDARLSHLHLTRNLDVTGTRINELARRAGLTKQAMSQLVEQCEQLGLVTRKADKQDARGKIVAFTAHGLEWLNAFKTALLKAEDEMRQELGALRVDGLTMALTSYGAAFDPLKRFGKRKHK